jgi:hypothetical protein
MNGEDLDRAPLSPVDGSVVETVAEVLPRRPRWRRFLVPGLIGLGILGGFGWIGFNRIILPLMILSQMKPQPTPVPLANPKATTSMTVLTTPQRLIHVSL